MALEDLTGLKYINSLVATNPVGNTDKVQTLDDHIRGIKNTLLNTFPNVTGAVTATHTELSKLTGATFTTAEANKLAGLLPTTVELNYVQGVTSSIQTQLNTILAKNIVAGNGLTGGGLLSSGTTITLTLGTPLPCNAANTAEVTATGHRHAIDLLTIATGMIIDSAITTTKIADGAVTSSKIASSSVGSTHLASASVITSALGTGAVTTAKLADANVTEVKLATDSVSTIKLANLAVTEAKLAAGSVTNTKLGALAVTGNKVAVETLEGKHAIRFADYPALTVTAADTYSAASLHAATVTGTVITNSTTPVTAYTHAVTHATGTVRYKCSHYVTNASYLSYLRIQKNGVTVNTFSTSSTTAVQQTQDVAVSPGDVITWQHWNTSGGTVDSVAQGSVQYASDTYSPRPLYIAASLL